MVSTCTPSTGEVMAGWSQGLVHPQKFRNVLNKLAILKCKKKMGGWEHRSEWKLWVQSLVMKKIVSVDMFLLLLQHSTHTHKLSGLNTLFLSYSSADQKSALKSHWDQMNVLAAVCKKAFVHLHVTIGKVQFLVDLRVKFLFSFWLTVANHTQLLNSTWNPWARRAVTPSSKDQFTFSFFLSTSHLSRNQEKLSAYD